MKLQAWLTENQTSVNDFAESIGVSRQALHRYLTGARIPKQDVLARISKATAGKVTANDFYAEAGEGAECT